MRTFCFVCKSVRKIQDGKSPTGYLFEAELIPVSEQYLDRWEPGASVDFIPNGEVVNQAAISIKADHDVFEVGTPLKIVFSE